MSDKLQRVFCVTVYIKDEQQRFLMLHHKKLNKWVPPGGKIDPNETPDEAAVRECFEETGLKITLVGEKTPVDGGLVRPYGVQVNCVVPNVSDHVDLIYLAKVDGPIAELNISEREAYAIGWFTLKELETLDTFPDVLQWCTHFVSH